MLTAIRLACSAVVQCFEAVLLSARRRSRSDVLGQVLVAAGLRIQTFHASSTPPEATACFLPVVTMVASVMGTSASVATSWHNYCLRV